LIDAIGEEVELDEGALIPDIVGHVLRPPQVTCLGALKGVAGAL
jgi:hypothetical protein